MHGQASRLNVTVAGQALALPQADIAEIVRVPVCTRVPNGPASLLGLANLRGSVLPVVSLAALLGQAQAEAGRRSRLVVLAGAAPIGLLVDEVAALAGEGDARLIDTRALLERDFALLRRSAAMRRALSLGKPLEDDRQQAMAPDLLALIGLRVGGQDFALKLESVTEIMRLPETPGVVPRTDDAMLGVTAFRGGLLPMVSLAVLLGLKQSAPAKGGRIIVVTVSAASIGLVVDGVTGTLAVPREAIDAVPPVLTRAAGEALLEGICRLEGGGKLVGLLATERLFDTQTLDRIKGAGLQGVGTPGADDQVISQMSDPAEAAGQEQFVLFDLGGEQYGLPVGAVDEVLRRPDRFTRMPHAPDFILGVWSLRGHPVPVIDMALRFGAIRGSGKAPGAAKKGRVIVVSIDGLQAGLAVDSVSEVLRVTSAALRAAPEFEAGKEALFDRVALQHEGRMVLLVSPRGVLARAERDLLAEMAADTKTGLPAAP